ncbi:TrmH family RNA methyltransferase [Anoxynatronum buryatiense]|uniref:RNA methyltransferase, TrmH family n=1 Tax=Anoxynatronum buryatiense TaxID=489973 RepID=A0AA45WT54_9CLOT|nr:RNA methyltransferase [Anoxynatronum buryatiense]SMP40697.1 RNA methyltransferase, TrmH family [Anoxynatronum buryatiense]
MRLIGISSTANEICKKTIALHQRRHRREQGLFLLEGFGGIQDALKGGWEPVYFIADHGFISREENQSLIQHLSAFRIPGYEMPSHLMKRMADTEHPQGVLAVFRQPVHQVQQLLEKPCGFWLMLDRIQDPGNLGTLIRSAEAAGLAGVLLTHGSTDPYNPKALRAATGAVLHLPVIELSEADSDGISLKKAGLRLVGAALEGGSSCYEQSYQSPLVLVIGNEAKGIGDALMRNLDQRVTIPMKGAIQSLNAAIAGSILMFHLARELNNPSGEASCIP